MTSSYQRPKRSVIIFFLLAALLLAACGTELSGSNWPGLSANGDIVYVAYGPQVLAVDVAAQRQLWAFPAEQSTVQFFAAPSIANGRIVIGDYGAPGGFFSPGVVVSLYALNADGAGNPTPLWTDNSVAKDKIIAPPLQVGDTVYVGTGDNNVFALDASTGAVNWRFQTEHGIWGQPTYAGDVVYVASLDKNLYALDAGSGRLVWKKALPGALPGKPIVADGVVYVGNFDEKLHAFDARTGAEIWAAPAEDWVWGAPAVAGDRVFFADIKGNIYAVSAADGSEIWRQTATGSVRGDLLLSEDGILYVASVGDPGGSQGQLLALTTEDGRQLWQATTSSPIQTSPVLADDRIVVAVQQENALLLVFDRATGVQQWQFAPAN